MSTLAQNVPVAGFGYSLKFDGVDDYAQINNYNGPTGDFTIEFWVKPVDLNGGWRGFFGDQPTSDITSRAPSMWQNGDVWHCDMYDSSGKRFNVNISNVFQNANEWVHLAWVKSGTTMYYYRNGRQIQTRTAPPNGDYKTTNTLRFGKVDNFYNANFDEVRIWSVARTQQQINDYRFRNLDNTTGLLHYYPLDEGSGTVINDAVGGKNGTLVGGAIFESATSSPPLTTPEDTTVSSYAKGSEVDGDALTFAFTSNGSKGTAAFDNTTTGAFTYTPNANANGADSFQYTVSDTDGTSAAATVNVTITAVNDLPTGQPDHYHIAEDGVLMVTAGVLDNDIDLDGDHLTAVLVTNVSNGTLALDRTGAFTYTPTANYNGNDSFTYKPNDGVADATNAVTVTLRVDPINDAPLGNLDGYTINEDRILTVSAANGVLRNDLDPEGTALTATAFSTPANGTLSGQADGSFSYTPNANFNGTDSFTYKASDGDLLSNPQTVSITVRAANDDPVVHDDLYHIGEDGTLNVPAPGILINDTDPDGDHLNVDHGHQGYTPAMPTNGTLVALNDDGSFTYRPDPDFNGADSFQYVLTDGTAHVAYGTVRITVTASNDAPVSNDDLYTVAEDGLLTIAASAGLSNILDNDHDVENNTLTVSLVSGPSSGNLHLDGQHGDFQYRPNANFNGTDQFTYKAYDGLEFGNTATVKILVHAENDSPVAQPDTYSVAQGGLLTVGRALGLLSNDRDTDGNTLYVQLTSGPSHGTLQMRLDGSFTYQHNGLSPVVDSFSYRPFDGAPVPGTPPSESGLGNEVTVTLVINRVNHAPLGAVDNYSALQNKELRVPGSVGVLSNDLDIDGDPMIALLASYPTNGALSLNSDGSFNYRPASGFAGTDTFTYWPMDGKERGNVTNVSIAVSTVNTPPILGNDTYYTQSTQTLTVNAARGVLANDIDPEGRPLRVTRVGTAPAKGTLQLNSDGSFTYIPGATFSTSDTFTYYATDGADEASNPATVTINQAPAQNQNPTTSPNSYSVEAGKTLQVSAVEGVLGNDSDPDGQLLSATLVSISAGTINLALDGSFTFYAPATAGTVTLVYRAEDGVCNLNSSCPTEQATITVTDPPPVLPVPGLRGWHLILLALGISFFSLLGIQRRHGEP